jgi:hypothetical protein
MPVLVFAVITFQERNPWNSITRALALKKKRRGRPVGMLKVVKYLVTSFMDKFDNFISVAFFITIKENFVGETDSRVSIPAPSQTSSSTRTSSSRTTSTAWSSSGESTNIPNSKRFFLETKMLKLNFLFDCLQILSSVKNKFHWRTKVNVDFILEKENPLFFLSKFITF